jgi:hypothetical protein
MHGKLSANSPAIEKSVGGWDVDATAVQKGSRWGNFIDKSTEYISEVV